MEEVVDQNYDSEAFKHQQAARKSLILASGGCWTAVGNGQTVQEAQAHIP
jgi:hypothetical protein